MLWPVWLSLGFGLVWLLVGRVRRSFGGGGCRRREGWWKLNALVLGLIVVFGLMDVVDLLRWLLSGVAKFVIGD